MNIMTPNWNQLAQSDLRIFDGTFNRIISGYPIGHLMANPSLVVRLTHKKLSKDAKTFAHRDARRKIVFGVLAMLARHAQLMEDFKL